MFDAFPALPADLVADLLSVEAIRGVFPCEGSKTLSLHITEPSAVDIASLCARLGRPVPSELRVSELLEQLEVLEGLATSEAPELAASCVGLSRELARPSIQRRLSSLRTAQGLGLVQSLGDAIARRHGYQTSASVHGGTPSCQWLDVGDPLLSSDRDAPSSFTLVRRTSWWGPGATGLSVAHGVLDLRPGSSLVRKTIRAKDNVRVSARPVPSGPRARGRVIAALLDENHDFAIVHFDDLPTDRTHPGVGATKPSLVPRGYASRGARVQMWPSRVTAPQAGPRAGRLVSMGSVELRMRVGHQTFWHRYRRCYEVAPLGDYFSRGGDSGSLVVLDGMALGLVIGGLSDGSRSYVLPLDLSIDLSRRAFRAFFNT